MAHHYVFADMSISSAVNDAVFARKAGAVVGDAIHRDALLGDDIAILPVGVRSVESSVATTLTLGPAYRQDDAAQTVGDLIASLPGRPDAKQPGTNLIYALENAGIQCGGRGTVTIISDGRDSSLDVNDAAIIDGTGSLPAPTTKYLHGCKITVLGIGLSVTDHPLTNAQTINLKNAWMQYFVRAGADPSRVTLRTAL